MRHDVALLYLRFVGARDVRDVAHYPIARPLDKDAFTLKLASTRIILSDLALPPSA